MPAFLINARDGSVAMLVRARCISCARSVGVEHAGSEGTRMWRDPEMSSVELVRNHPQGDGKPALLQRTVTHAR